MYPIPYTRPLYLLATASNQHLFLSLSSSVGSKTLYFETLAVEVDSDSAQENLLSKSSRKDKIICHISRKKF